MKKFEVPIPKFNIGQILYTRSEFFEKHNKLFICQVKITQIQIVLNKNGYNIYYNFKYFDGKKEQELLEWEESRLYENMYTCFENLNLYENEYEFSGNYLILTNADFPKIDSKVKLKLSIRANNLSEFLEIDKLLVSGGYETKLCEVTVWDMGFSEPMFFNIYDNKTVDIIKQNRCQFTADLKLFKKMDI